MKAVIVKKSTGKNRSTSENPNVCWTQTTSHWLMLRQKMVHVEGRHSSERWQPKGGAHSWKPGLWSPLGGGGGGTQGEGVHERSCLS